MLHVGLDEAIEHLCESVAEVERDAARDSTETLATMSQATNDDGTCDNVAFQ